MNIGEIIKKLRKQKDMTQEQLAEYLNISPQAVSRWEINSTLPDITLLPAIANIFGVSADVLLSIDVTAKEKQIQDIIDRVYKYRSEGDYEKAVEILRGGLKEYPNSYKIMGELMACIGVTRNGKTTDEALTLTNEIINLGEKILEECTDDGCRHNATQLLCYAYSNPKVGKTEKAIELAEKMPNYFATRESLLENIYTGDKKFKQKQENMLKNFGIIIMGMGTYSGRFDGGEEKSDEYGGYTVEEDIAIRKKINALLEVMFEDGNYGFFRHMMIYNCIEMAISYAKLNDYNNAIEILQLSADHAIKFDTGYDQSNEFTSLLFKGIRNIFYHHTKENDSMHQLEKMKHSTFDPIRENEAFIEIEENLKKYAKHK